MNCEQLNWLLNLIQNNTFPNDELGLEWDSFILEKIMCVSDTPMMKVLQFVSREWRPLFLEIWNYWSGPKRMGVLGVRTLVQWLYCVDTWCLEMGQSQWLCLDEQACANAAMNGHMTCWVGQGRMIVLGMITLVQMLLLMDILKCWCGQERMVVLGMKTLLGMLQQMDTLKC